MILLGDCLVKLKELESNYVDAIITDPPYGLKFMNKHWDHTVPSVEIWKEALRVLKPGGHLLSFGGTRTYHRMVVNIEDAGFEIRDQIQWIYGSGFPKSLDVSKAIDKAAGAKREVIAECGSDGVKRKPRQMIKDGDSAFGVVTIATQKITAPSTLFAKQWNGWGTALKPANEPICMARKPLENGLTVAENVLKWGCGAINIETSRIGDEIVEKGIGGRHETESVYNDGLAAQKERKFVMGRWPANVLFDEEAAALLGEPSRFFYVAKASKSERNAGLEGMPLISQGHIASDSGGGGGLAKDAKKNPNLPRANHHPTVKPVKLMQYLIKLITPPNGTVLDPFMGSGSTGVAAKNLGFNFIGIELNEDYFEISKKRIGE